MQTRVIMIGASVAGLVAGVMLLVGGHAPVWCREMGALFLVAVACFTAIIIAHFKIEFYLRSSMKSLESTVESQGRTIQSQESIIELLQERRKLR